MRNLDCQRGYWNEAGLKKPFAHPVNLDRLAQWLSHDSRILDVGCGYGRALGFLSEQGYKNLFGLDPAPAMIAAARTRFPLIRFAEFDPPRIPIPDGSVDGVLLFSVLTCIPTDEGQLATIAETRRVLTDGGLLYLSDLWLQTDDRNLERYRRDHAKYGTFGVFDLPEGVTVRHHDPAWIQKLTRDFERCALDDIEVITMNGNAAKGFQWFGAKRETQGSAHRTTAEAPKEI